MANQRLRTAPHGSSGEPLLRQLPSHQHQPSHFSESSQLHHLQASQTRPRKQFNINLHRLPSQILLLSFTILLTCITPLASASAILISEQMVETPKEITPPAPENPEDPRSALSRLAKSAPILVDLSPPPKAATEWMLANVEDDLRRRKRQVGGDDGTQPSSSSKLVTSTRASGHVTSTATKPSSTTTKASTTTGIAVAEETGSRPLPQIFDSGFNGNLTSSCQSFMDDMLRNEVFKSCLPFSLLLQNSNSFFQTTKSVTLTTRLLDYTCAASPTTCAPLLSNLATNLTSVSTCGPDLSAGNPQVRQAQLGMLAYRPLYTASCLRNAKTSSYCFADAITNKTSSADGYTYYLPLNMGLDPNATMTCSQCLRDTMAVFSSSEGDGTGKSKGVNQALASTYTGAAERINQVCGAGFVNTTMAVRTSGSVRISSAPSTTGLLALVLVIAGWLL